MSLHASHLRLAARHCPRALDFADCDTRIDRAPFEAGIAAHCVLAALGEATEQYGAMPLRHDREHIAARVFKRLVTRRAILPGGWRREPPLSADRAAEGRDLALAYVARFPLVPGAAYGRTLAARRRGAAWVPSRRRVATPPHFRGYIDRLALHVEHNAAGAAEWVVELRDYSTAWSTDEDTLDTLELRSHAVLAALFYPHAQRLRREVVNLRTLHPFVHELALDDDGRALLERWRRDVDAAIAALSGRDARGRRPAVPGGGCHGCPYLHRCEDALHAFAGAAVPTSGTPKDRARAFAVLTGWHESLKAAVKADTDEAPIRLEDGRLVGTLPKTQRALAAAAPARLAEAWARDHGAQDLAGLAAAAKLGVTQAEALAKAIYPQRTDKPDRDEFLAGLTTTAVVRSFGVHEAPQAEGHPQ